MPGIPRTALDECRCCLYMAQNSHSYQGSVPSKQLALVPLANCCVLHTCSNTQRLVIYKPPSYTPVAMQVVKLHTCNNTHCLAIYPWQCKSSSHIPVTIQTVQLYTCSSSIHPIIHIANTMQSWININIDVKRKTGTCTTRNLAYCSNLHVVFVLQ